MEEDTLRNLPESLLFEVLLKVPTKDLVKTSVLSSSWRNMWKLVPGLNLNQRDFTDCNAFVSFMDEFLGFNSVSCIQKFKLKLRWEKPEAGHITRWINEVVERKVQHLRVVVDNTWLVDGLGIPTTVYTCKSLVSLMLYETSLPNPDFVSLPCLKVLVLDQIVFANDLTFERLISGCPVLESLTVSVWNNCLLKVVRVSSQSLLSFTYYSHVYVEALVVAIDAPRLEYLKLHDYETLYDYETASFIIESPGSLVKVDIDIRFGEEEFNQNDLPKRNMIRSFIFGISRVKALNISSCTLEEFSNYSRCEPLPLFCNLSLLHVDLNDCIWQVLPIFLESCPNLKSLFLEFSNTRRVGRIGTLPEPRQLLTSLEYVKIVQPRKRHLMKLGTYFLENSPILKKFTFVLGGFIMNKESVILKKLLAIPRLSSSCKFSFFDYSRN